VRGRPVRVPTAPGHHLPAQALTLAGVHTPCEAAPNACRITDVQVGVVIVDHGSRKAASNEMLVEFGQLYTQLTGHGIVEIAHMEIAEPTIAHAIGECGAATPDAAGGSAEMRQRTS
jgi:hypothetical protein